MVQVNVADLEPTKLLLTELMHLHDYLARDSGATPGDAAQRLEGALTRFGVALGDEDTEDAGA